TGFGMSAEVMARAFEPFFSTKPVGAGSGLGLSMIYGFAQQSGGQLKIRSEVGKGSTVCLYLPHHAVGLPDGVFVEAASDSTQVAAGKTALVVEPEPSIRQLVVELLSGVG